MQCKRYLCISGGWGFSRSSGCKCICNFTLNTFAYTVCGSWMMMMCLQKPETKLTRYTHMYIYLTTPFGHLQLGLVCRCRINPSQHIQNGCFALSLIVETRRNVNYVNWSDSGWLRLREKPFWKSIAQIRSPIQIQIRSFIRWPLSHSPFPNFK